MITERANKLIELSEQYRRRDQERRQRQDYERLRDGVKEVDAVLFPPYGTSVTLRDLRDRGVSGLGANVQARLLKEQVTDALGKFNASTASLVGQTPFPMPAVKRTAVAVADRADDELARLWASYVDREARPVPVDLVELFARVPGKREIANEVLQLAGEARTARANPPRDRAALDAFHDLLARLTTALKQLFQGGDGPGEISEEVREFIEAASSPGGAPLTAARATVIGGLTRMGILGSFVVRTTAARSNAI